MLVKSGKSPCRPNNSQHKSGRDWTVTHTLALEKLSNQLGCYPRARCDDVSIRQPVVVVMVSSFPFSARPTATPARQPTRRHPISLAFRTRPASLLLLSKSPWRTYSTPRCVESFCFFIILFSPWACERPRDCDFLYHVIFNSTCISYCHCNVSATSRYVSQWIDCAVYLAHTNALSSTRAALTVS